MIVDFRFQNLEAIKKPPLNERRVSIGDLKSQIDNCRLLSERVASRNQSYINVGIIMPARTAGQLRNEYDFSLFGGRDLADREVHFRHTTMRLAAGRDGVLGEAQVDNGDVDTSRLEVRQLSNIAETKALLAQ